MSAGVFSVDQYKNILVKAQELCQQCDRTKEHLEWVKKLLEDMVANTFFNDSLEGSIDIDNMVLLRQEMIAINQSVQKIFQIYNGNSR